MDGGESLDLVALATAICERYRLEYPDERERYGDAGNAWCVHDNQHLLNWATGSVNGELDIRLEVAWLATVLEARDFPADRLARDLDIGADIVLDQVAGTGGRKLAAVLTATADFVRSGTSGTTPFEPRPKGHGHRAVAGTPEAATVSGKLFTKRKEIGTPGQGSDPDARKRLWEESERLTNRSGPRIAVIGDSISACPEVAATRSRATVMSGSGRRAVGHPAHNQQ